MITPFKAFIGWDKLNQKEIYQARETYKNCIIVRKITMKRNKKGIYFIFCLLVWSFLSNSRIFYAYGDVTISGEGLQIMNYARYLWQFSIDDSLACHPFFENFNLVTRASVYSGHLPGPVTLAPNAELCGPTITCFKDLDLSRLGFEHPTLRLRGERSNLLRLGELCLRAQILSIWKMLIFSISIYLLYLHS